MKSCGFIEISGPNNPKINTHNDISVVFLLLWRRAVDGAADVKSDGIIENSSPNNPKIVTYNDTSIISYEF